MRVDSLNDIDESVWRILSHGCYKDLTEEDVLKECNGFSDYLYYIDGNCFEIYVKWAEIQPELCTDGKLDNIKYAEHQRKFCESLIDFMNES